MRIDQFHPSFSYGDAIGDNLYSIRNIIRELGFESNIYAQHIHENVKKDGKNYSNLKNDLTDSDVLLVHYSIWSDIYPEIFELPCIKVFVYHNITPPKFLEKYNPTLSEYAKIGLEKLKEIKKHFEFSLADSEFNKQELEKIGFENVYVLPITIDFEKFKDVKEEKIFNDNKTNILFVGRIAPNKKQEDIIKSFYYYNKFINTQSRLILAGNYRGMESYKEDLEILCKKLGLQDDVIFTGHTKFSTLVNYYNSADLFLSMSEHEGFCVPLLEAMYFNIPIIAYESSAIPYTLGVSGIVFRDKEHKKIAELMNFILTNVDIKKEIISHQQNRVNVFSRDKLKQYIIPFIKMIEEIVCEKMESLKLKNSKKNITFVTSNAQDGIHEYTKNLMQGFDEKGYNVSFCGVKNRDFGSLKNQMNFLVEQDTVIFEHEEGIFDANDLVWVMKKLKNSNVEVILSPHELEIFKFSDYKRLHNIVLKKYSNKKSHFIETLLNLAKINILYLRLKKNLYNLGSLSDRIVVHSNKQLELINTIYTHKTDVVYAPLPVKQLQGDKFALRKKLGLSLDKFIFIIPGFIFRRKRIIEVILNMPSEALLVIAGTESEYDPGYLKEINDVIEDNGIENVIINNEYDLMEDFLMSSDCVVLYYSDIFQSAVASLAIGANKPCVFSNIDGFKDYKDVGLFAANDSELKDCLNTISKNQNLYSELVFNVEQLKEELQPRNIAKIYLGE